MKKSFQIAVISLLLTICLGACSKKNDNNPTASASSTWSFSGTTYNAATIVFTNNSLLGVSKANSQETIGILFSSRPAAGSYDVVSTNVSGGQCSIQATGAGNQVVFSQGGGKVNLTVSGGKIHATFSGVPVVNVSAQAAGSISGDLTE